MAVLCYIFKEVSVEHFFMIIFIICLFAFCISNIVQKAIYYDYKEEIENYKKIISKKNENEEKLHNIIGQYKDIIGQYKDIVKKYEKK
jgi:cell division protein FtsL